MKCIVKGIAINYEIMGEGKPMLMLHGYSPDHRLMTGCMERVTGITDNFKRIYLDLPGMGKSESAEWINSSDIMLDIVLEFIEKIIPDENFLIAGESYGGYLSRGIVYRIGHRVDGMVLICPAIIADMKKRQVPKHQVLVKDDEILASLTIEQAEDFNSIAVIQNREIYERYKKEIVCGLKIADDEFLDYFKKSGYEFSFKVDDENRKFHKPVLMILGRQDCSVGYRDALNIIENFPRGTFAVLDMAGHNLQIEQPYLFNALVNEWVERIKIG